MVLEGRSNSICATRWGSTSHASWNQSRWLPYGCQKKRLISGYIISYWYNGCISWICKIWTYGRQVMSVIESKTFTCNINGFCLISINYVPPSVTQCHPVDWGTAKVFEDLRKSTWRSFPCERDGVTRGAIWEGNSAFSIARGNRMFDDQNSMI